MNSKGQAPRIGARVLLLNPCNEVLLIHAHDPDFTSCHWWELPGGGRILGESLIVTARRETLEETGIRLTEIGRILWIYESRFQYRGRSHHHLNHVYLARTELDISYNEVRYTSDEEKSILQYRWWPLPLLQNCDDLLLPAELPEILHGVLWDVA